MLQKKNIHCGQIFYHVLQAIRCLHQYGYIHGDIKQKNILAAEQGGQWQAKICDYDLLRSASLKVPYAHAHTPGIYPEDYVTNHAADPDPLAAMKHRDYFSAAVAITQCRWKCIPIPDTYPSIGKKCIADTGNLYATIEHEPREAKSELYTFYPTGRGPEDTGLSAKEVQLLQHLTSLRPEVNYTSLAQNHLDTQTLRSQPPKQHKPPCRFFSENKVLIICDNPDSGYHI